MTIAFAYPGDLETLTGGYGYDRRLIAALREAGETVDLLPLPGAFPDAAHADVEAAAARLAAVPADTALVVDGLAYGALPAAALTDVTAPLVALCHHPLALETGVDPALAPAMAATERAALALADAVVVTSPTTAAILSADYGVPADGITVALPGLDPSWGRIVRAPATPPLVVSVGSLIPRKGHDVLIAALASLADLPWRAVIVGGHDHSPETVAALQAQAAPLGGRVALPGSAREAELRALYAEATVFALATRYEGFGMVFAEAMAAGLPIVATSGGAVPDVVPAGAGLLVPVDDVAAVAAALRSVLADPALAARLSDGARAAAARFGDWDTTAAAVIEAVRRARDHRDRAATTHRHTGAR